MNEKHVTYVLIVALLIVFVGGAAQRYGGGICNYRVTTIDVNSTIDYKDIDQ